MKLPKDSNVRKQEKHKAPTLNTWIVVLSIAAIVISIASAGFSAFVYISMPSQVQSYVESHKDELKGEKGDQGEMGPTGLPGRNGVNSYAPTYCSTFDYSFGSSTSCY